MTSFSVPNPRPAARHIGAIRLPNFKRTFTPGVGPRVSRSTFVPRSAPEPRR